MEGNKDDPIGLEEEALKSSNGKAERDKGTLLKLAEEECRGKSKL